MIGVDRIGEIRRAFFERHLPIKEIVRTLSVSRATVRKVVPVQIGDTSIRARDALYHLQAPSTAFQTAGAARP